MRLAPPEQRYGNKNRSNWDLVPDIKTVPVGPMMEESVTAASLHNIPVNRSR